MSSSVYFVTGGAGFIASNLVGRLVGDGHEVVVYDNLSTGQEEFLVPVRGKPNFKFVKADLLDTAGLAAAMKGCDFVYHLAANADVRFGLNHPRKDLEQNTIATYNVLEAMRSNGIHRMGFASTGAVYGESAVFPTPEDAPFPVQTSLYGASKLACEGLICAYCEGYGFEAWIFRFVGILGEHYTHGHVFDFYKKLVTNPKELHVLGDGKQRKSYLYAQDCVEAMLTAVAKAKDKINIFNLGREDYCVVNESIGWIIKELRLNPKITYAGGARGWVGDSPFIQLDTRRIRALGWTPKLTIQEGVLRTLHYLQTNPWILERR